jgi:hypothetical protein
MWSLGGPGGSLCQYARSRAPSLVGERGLPQAHKILLCCPLWTLLIVMHPSRIAGRQCRYIFRKHGSTCSLPLAIAWCGGRDSRPLHHPTRPVSFKAAFPPPCHKVGPFAAFVLHMAPSAPPPPLFERIVTLATPHLPESLPRGSMSSRNVSSVLRSQLCGVGRTQPNPCTPTSFFVRHLALSQGLYTQHADSMFAPGQIDVVPHTARLPRPLVRRPSLRRRQPLDPPDEQASVPLPHLPRQASINNSGRRYTAPHGRLGPAGLETSAPQIAAL